MAENVGDIFEIDELEGVDVDPNLLQESTVEEAEEPKQQKIDVGHGHNAVASSSSLIDINPPLPVELPSETHG